MLFSVFGVHTNASLFQLIGFYADFITKTQETVHQNGSLASMALRSPYLLMMCLGNNATNETKQNAGDFTLCEAAYQIRQVWVDIT